MDIWLLDSSAVKIIVKIQKYWEILNPYLIKTSWEIIAKESSA